MKPLEIAKKINRQLKVDVFKNTRKQQVVEARSLLCYILRNKLRLRWTNIALFFRNNGKSMNHATVIHNCNMFHTYKKVNTDLLDVFKTFKFKSNLSFDEIDRIHYLENKCKNLEAKLKEYDNIR
jgi:chromosomal replication initiation ATPase DnaA